MGYIEYKKEQFDKGLERLVQEVKQEVVNDETTLHCRVGTNRVEEIHADLLYLEYAKAAGELRSQAKTGAVVFV